MGGAGGGGGVRGRGVSTFVKNATTSVSAAILCTVVCISGRDGQGRHASQKISSTSRASHVCSSMVKKEKTQLRP